MNLSRLSGSSVKRNIKGCCACPTNRAALERGDNPHNRAISIEAVVLEVNLSRNVSCKSNLQSTMCETRCLSTVGRLSTV